MTKRSLDDILADDDILAIPDEAPKALSLDERVREDFEEINRFFEEHGRLPAVPAEGQSGKVSAIERRLAIRLGKFRSSPELAATMAPVDRHGLLQPQEAERPKPTSVDEIFATDDGILDRDGDDIFELRFVGQPKRQEPDWIASRVPCPDFDRFRPVFDACAADMQSGRRTTARFRNEQEIGAGEFFILNGVLVYVAEVNDRRMRNGKTNARLRCIYDNGTESELLLRSLARHLYKDENGRRVSNPEAGPLFGSEVKDGDVRSGCVYIAASLSQKPELAAMTNLYKIGVTVGQPERRVRRAERDPTFLMAPARLVKKYTIFNSDPAKVERILHAFFGQVGLALKVTDRFGAPIQPREWFVVPIEAVDRAIQLLMEGSIAKYRYDKDAQDIVPL